jgi:hypothetical protein
MKKLTTVIVGLASALSLFSCQKSSPPKQDIQNANTVIAVDESNSNVTIDLTKLSDLNRSKYECIQSVCGTDYPFKNTYESDTNLIEKNKKTVQATLGRDIELLMGRIIKIEFKLKDVIDSFSKIDANTIQLTTVQKGLISIQKYLNYDLKPAIDFVKKEGDAVDIVFKADALRKINPDWTRN